MVSTSNIGQGNQPTNIYAPFSSQTDWEFTRWAKLHGPISTAVIDLLNIPGEDLFLFILILAQLGVHVQESRAVIQDFKVTQCHY